MKARLRFSRRMRVLHRDMLPADPIAALRALARGAFRPRGKRQKPGDVAAALTTRPRARRRTSAANQPDRRA
jgi:hypothetical protein